MVNNSVPDLDAVFRALADPTRRGIVAALNTGPMTVGALARPFDISLPAVSKHLKVLERAGLVTREVHGREHRLRFEPQSLTAARDWLSYYSGLWQAQLDAIDALLDDGEEI
ncbi:MAG: metalloregulator ArsR/SmtB family transcription factor [Gammaproteobacteria bacterium]|nr:metalloregulator ArsR/SmtB family transcription factor [Gammaproteobacteria bacterium]NIO23683.1 metalloregulator ArsR/SmtB family transcription factor [Gammaproteobacteria bacterium]NIO64299.1 metalloregulator ArsR/SmtB family transcription factor [Gammaproteobacteria bacterium]NIP46178.1 helix-turn-helix transcriptional regulator [Gammaproteobacteria bacterium]NIP63181.1 metalloregulator ArsR/SmtB family transcription factor [Gammaproteobacteria bacterium]